ncbi:hypothetical protein Trydic_g13212 [Trypoxylus dichotomus]
MKRILILVLSLSIAVAWNTCSDEPFCDRIRNEGVISPLFLDKDSINSDLSSVEAILTNAAGDINFTLSISATENDIFRITIDSESKPRYRVSQALKSEPTLLPITATIDADELQVVSGENLLLLDYATLKISIYKEDKLILIINDQGKIAFNEEEEDQSIAMDFTFLGAVTAYGIPEHAERLSLQSTGPGGLSPYRLYNADYPGYPIGTQEALYGTIPVLYGHGVNGTSGIFWLNAAQSFVDIARTDNSVQSLFISESGIIDIFVLPGPTFQSAVKQYISLTGTTPLPQYYTLGHHQSRWSYVTQEEAETVVKEFDNYDLPLDVIWLDIDYTNGFRYFTWNYTAFPDPTGLQEFIDSTGRKVVLIIDPHFKVDNEYFVWVTATENNYFVKNPNGTDYQASCWPDLSSWIDYLNKDAADYYASLYGMDKFTDVTDIVQFWNDMNEPAVFDVFEKTFPRDLVHYGGVIHRDVHNIYGLSQTVATYHGLLARYNYNKRPFVLTRSHFAGTQRYSAIWTGDNLASWEHLRISFPMCLTQAISGISYCGADVGGFSGQVTEELFQRWYQAGAWLPFYRAHSDQYTERREPYLFSEEVLNRIRNAIRQRYTYLPMWYTLFFEHERYEEPVITPLSYRYPSDRNTLDMDDQWLIGRDVLVHPVAEEGATEVQVYMPGGSTELWYDIENSRLYLGHGFFKVSVTMDSIPVYYRGGSILIKKEISRPSSSFMHDDPYTIYIFLDTNNQATGTLYIDDNESFDYRSGEYNYYRLEYNDSSLTISVIDEDASYELGLFKIQRIWIYRPPTNYKEAVVDGDARHAVSYEHDNFYLKIENVNINVKGSTTISFM